MSGRPTNLAEHLENYNVEVSEQINVLIRVTYGHLYAF